MAECDPVSLNAYVDGELDAQAKERVERHLFDCASCAREVAMLRAVSEMVRNGIEDELSPDELSRLHHAIDDDADRPIFRLGGVLGTIAASVLIIGAAWMMELPAPAPNAPRLHSRTTASSQSWEQVAMTLRVEPPFSAGGPEQDNRIEIADAMMNGLTPAQP
ncbi:MAG TPA: zf-HC2 domain-containing protein [Tepidisphaeraceae bacterium]|jgi:anti-sigma factor RsiW